MLPGAGIGVGRPPRAHEWVRNFIRTASWMAKTPSDDKPAVLRCDSCHSEPSMTVPRAHGPSPKPRMPVFFRKKALPVAKTGSPWWKTRVCRRKTDVLATTGGLSPSGEPFLPTKACSFGGRGPFWGKGAASHRATRPSAARRRVFLVGKAVFSARWALPKPK
jgi:hypothetical protein